MISFKQFLLEGMYDDNSAYHPKEMSEEAFVGACEKSSSSYLASAKSAPIYRGMVINIETFGTIDTNRFNRVSANTYNYYTVWMDGNPDWAAYPKRSKSYICSTGIDYTSGFGEGYIVIPEDNAKIGICPEEDLWDSFSEVKKSFGSFSQMGEIMSKLDKTFRDLDIDNHAAAKSYENLVYALKHCTREAISSVDKGNYFIEPLEKHNLASLYELFDKILKPTDNGFKVTTAANLKKTKGESKELWIQGRVMIVKLDYLKKLKSGPAHDFFSKYF